MNDSFKIRQSIRRWLWFFIVALVLSGLTAFPIESGLAWICSWWPDKDSSFYCWLDTSYNAIRVRNENYPFLAYGYDWLALFPSPSLPVISGTFPSSGACSIAASAFLAWFH